MPIQSRPVPIVFHSRAILNICFPYTSREEITSAVRKTVEEHSKALPPHSTSFAQSRITQKILSKQGDRTDVLSAIRETSPARSDDIEGSVSSSTTLHAESPPTRSSGQSNIAVYPNVESITSETIDRNMYTADCPPLDLFIRTSGVERLSDFMLWQCHQDTQIVFMDCFWPEFDLWHFLPVLVEWQWTQKKMREELGRGKKVV
jgi:ditrans,polycis-polyprenyl diphosphate synthase